MGYSHTFYALDVSELMALHGADNRDLLDSILKSQSSEIRDNDSFFEGEIREGDVPDTATAIQEIFAGNVRPVSDGALYGYTLKIICHHLGEQIEVGEGVAAVADHPYESFLLKLGSPIPIPEPSGFPEIGHLKFGHLDGEISIAKQCQEQQTGKSLEDMTFGDALNLLSMYQKPGAIYDEDIQEDVEAYIETLEAAKSLGKGVVSFRH